MLEDLVYLKGYERKVKSFTQTYEIGDEQSGGLETWAAVFILSLTSCMTLEVTFLQILISSYLKLCIWNT